MLAVTAYAVGRSTLPLWFRTNSVAFRRFRCGFARIKLRFDAPAVVSRDFRGVSTLPLWFRANSVACRCSDCGFARIPASSGVFWPLPGGPLRFPRTFVFLVPGSVVDFFEASSGLLWPLLALLTVWGLCRQSCACGAFCGCGDCACWWCVPDCDCGCAGVADAFCAVAMWMLYPHRAVPQRWSVQAGVHHL